VKDDEEYINNWVEKWDMLCEPKWKVGLLGAIAFIGVLFSTAFVPVISDKIGRKVVIVVTLGVSVLVQIWFMEA
jgi:MFS family permease